MFEEIIKSYDAIAYDNPDKWNILSVIRVMYADVIEFFNQGTI